MTLQKSQHVMIHIEQNQHILYSTFLKTIIDGYQLIGGKTKKYIYIVIRIYNRILKLSSIKSCICTFFGNVKHLCKATATHIKIAASNKVTSKVYAHEHTYN
jgi:hypothetical protein